MSVIGSDMKAHHLFTYALITAILVAYFVMAAWFPMAFIYATYEDLYGEWAQTFVFALSFLLAIRIALSDSRYRWFFTVLAGACFYTVMEEISWGQRIIGFESAEFFKEHNQQGETNLHNLLTGPYKTVSKDILRYTLSLGLVGYGLIFPLGLKYDIPFFSWLNRRGVAAPPLYLWPFFIVAAFLELKFLSFNEAEIAELLVGFGVMMMAIHYRFCDSHRIPPHKQNYWSQRHPATLRNAYLAAVALLAALSMTATNLVLSSPPRRATVEQRIENGMEKFAVRYQRYEQWHLAAALYEQLLQQDPDRSFILRQLANNYRHAGDEHLFQRYARRALEADLARDAANPGRASTNRSLARDYRLLGEDESADKHTMQALKIGLKRLDTYPDNAGAAYSLARTYALMDRDEDAVKLYRRAHELEPTSSRFRKAYYRARARAESGPN